MKEENAGTFFPVPVRTKNKQENIVPGSFTMSFSVRTVSLEQFIFTLNRPQKSVNNTSGRVP